MKIKTAPFSSIGRFKFILDSRASFMPGFGSGDLNGDRRDDIVVGGAGLSTNPAAQNSPVRLLVLKQDSSGDLKVWSGFAGGNTVLKGTTNPLIADFNGDGRGDIALPGMADYPVTPVPSVFFMSSGASYRRVDYADKISAHGANLADINRDGLKDVITAGYGSSKAGSDTKFNAEQYFISQYGADALPIWNTPFKVNGTPSDMSPGGSAVAADDLNGDGHVDYVVADAWDLSIPVMSKEGVFQRSDILVLKGDEKGMPTGPYAAKITPFFETNRTSYMGEYSGHPGSNEFSHDIRTQIADFDGDGRKDIIVLSVNFPGQQTASTLRIYKNMGDFKFEDMTSKWLPNYNIRWHADYSFQVKDFDGNGTIDIALSEGSYGAASRQGNAMFLNDGSGRMHMALRDEYKTWAAKFEKSFGNHVIDDFPHFYPVLTMSGKTNFFVLAEHSWNKKTNSPESLYATLKTEIDFNKDFKKGVKVSGGDGNDRLFGWAGNDSLYGREGNDVLKGGAGKDSFVFNTTPGAGNVDTIQDFSVVNDTVKLENAVFTCLGRKTGTMNEKLLHIGARAHDRSDRIIYDKKNGDLYYDPDGTGAAEQIKFADIAKNLKMTQKDFFVI